MTDLSKLSVSVEQLRQKSGSIVNGISFPLAALSHTYPWQTMALLCDFRADQKGQICPFAQIQLDVLTEIYNEHIGTTKAVATQLKWNPSRLDDIPTAWEYHMKNEKIDYRRELRKSSSGDVRRLHEHMKTLSPAYISELPSVYVIYQMMYQCDEKDMNSMVIAFLTHEILMPHTAQMILTQALGGGSGGGSYKKAYEPEVFSAKDGNDIMRATRGLVGRR